MKADSQVSIVIPNYNGMAFMEACLRAVLADAPEAEILVVDNGSTDGSQDYIKKKFPFCKLICLDQNYGFCRAVNEGFQAAESEYVILLNNDTEVKPDFSRKLLDAIRADQRRFSCQACMLQYQNPELTDDAGDFFCGLGWAFARGKTGIGVSEEWQDLFILRRGRDLPEKPGFEAGRV